jgi:hypothetical protein
MPWQEQQQFLMKDFRLAALRVNVMWSFCTILKCEKWMLGKFVFFIGSYIHIVYSTSRTSRRRGGYQTYGRAATKATTLVDNWRRVRNNREDDDGFEYLRN